MNHVIPCEPVYPAGQDVWMQDQEEFLPTYQETRVLTEKGASPWLGEEIIQTINTRVDELSPQLRELSLDIHG